jgi:uncharacterized Zn-binding protein involved in type VI secretion
MFPVAAVGIPASVTGFPLAPLGPGTIVMGAVKTLVGGLPVATVASAISPHGNPVNPKQPGFNPACAAAVIASGIPNVLVEFKPIAHVGSICTCGQHTVSLGIPNVLVG